MRKRSTNDLLLTWWCHREWANYSEARVITLTMFYGMVPMFILGGFAAFVRLSHFFRVGLRFRTLAPDAKSRLLYKFQSDTDVEVISR